MKFISWNVNGLRACVGKDFEVQFKTLNADFFCLQERDSWICSSMATSRIGIMPRNGAIQAQRYTPDTHL